MSRLLRLLRAPLIATLFTVAIASMLGCATMGVRSAVPMKLTRTKESPKDALVYIDGKYVGTLGELTKHGIRIPEGEHRLSVEKNGFYPFDKLIVSDRDSIELRVELLRIPD